MITSIRLQNFRSYQDVHFELDPGVNIIVGPNASGKTNLLEAVLFMARGGSYRARDTELMRLGAEWTRLDAQTGLGRRTIKLKNPDNTEKTYELDEQVYTRLHPTKMLPIVLFEPNHLQLMSGSPELRRNFLDDLIEQMDKGFGAVRRHYKRVLAQRNALLKRNPRDLQQQLFVWNVRLSELGGQIAKKRAELIHDLNQDITELYRNIATQNNTIELRYDSRFPEVSYETELLRKLESSTELDVLRGFTAYGPHRDDLAVQIDGHPMQDTASRGETRTLVLALKILELKRIEKSNTTKPLLLLDDVFSELDDKRRQALTKHVQNYQTFITTTNADIVTQNFPTSKIISL